MPLSLSLPDPADFARQTLDARALALPTTRGCFGLLSPTTCAHMGNMCTRSKDSIFWLLAMVPLAAPSVFFTQLSLCETVTLTPVLFCIFAQLRAAVTLPSFSLCRADQE